MIGDQRSERGQRVGVVRPLRERGGERVVARRDLRPLVVRADVRREPREIAAHALRRSRVVGRGERRLEIRARTCEVAVAFGQPRRFEPRVVGPRRHRLRAAYRLELVDRAVRERDPKRGAAVVGGGGGANASRDHQRDRERARELHFVLANPVGNGVPSGWKASIVSAELRA